MSFWNSLFGKKKPIKKQSYHEFPYPFRPNPSGVIELIHGGADSGLTPQQEAFIAWIETAYSRIVSKLVPLLEQEFNAWMPQLVIRDFAVEFTPICLYITACDHQPVKWTIVFDTVHDKNHTVAVDMLGYEPQNVHIDG